MKKIVTLTLNPSLDKSAKVDKLVPDRKLRSFDIQFEPGGGGINVSRAINKLGGETLAVYTKGGFTGDFFASLLEKENINQHTIDIQGTTRENLMIVETSTDQHFRFGMQGASLTDQEVIQLLDLIRNEKPEILVASGSLPPGLPVDFYSEIGKLAKELGALYILDTSGKALQEGVTEGVYLLKPNLGELSSLAGVESAELNQVDDIARELISDKTCKAVAVSLGPQGAILVTADVCEHIPSPPVHKKSVVGAGDSMVAGMVLKLAEGKDLKEVIRYGVAAGTAATITPGSELCRPEDVANIYEWILENS